MPATLRLSLALETLGPRSRHIELALWDIIGKDAGKPVYELLGGSPEPVRAYASTGQALPAAERIDHVQECVDAGFEGVKLRITEREHVEMVREVREAFPDLTLMVDANKGWSIPVVGETPTWSVKEALAVARELEEIGGIRWLEEPLHRHNYEGYARLRESTDIPIAGGEFNRGANELYEFLRQGALDVVQPDAALATGIKRATEVAAAAQDQGVEFIPHTWTNAVGFAANLHVMVAVDGPWCEFPHDPPWTPEAWNALITDPFTVDDGLVHPPEEPGLGVELDRDLLDE